MSAVMVKQTNLNSPQRALQLHRLLNGIVPAAELLAVPDIEIGDISSNSREVRRGGAFIALRGPRSHGLSYVADAVKQGASVVLWEPAEGVQAPASMGALSIAVPRLSHHVGVLADRFFAQPSAALKIAAITGTNGKTTTAHLLAAAAEEFGIAAGYMGTLGYGRVTSLQASAHTTPDCISVHRHLAELREAGADAVGMEVSSHALDQGRIDAVRVDTAVFTNLTRDHLDYHGTLEAYGAAKGKLFSWPGLRHRVINAGDAFGRSLLADSANGVQTTAYSIGVAADADRYVCAKRVRSGERGVELEIDSSWGAGMLYSRLLGEFNAENLLAVLAVLLNWNAPFAKAISALEQVNAPAGRMELHRSAKGKRAVIDYAHTPDALEKALRVLRPYCRGQLICVFGCGGDRDIGKRALMGALAEQLADRVIVTDDNPRSEDPAKIVGDILAGMQNRGAIAVEHDRAKAIEHALTAASSEDWVLIAGKGHEDYQIVGHQTRHFSDREVALQALRDFP